MKKAVQLVILPRATIVDPPEQDEQQPPPPPPPPPPPSDEQEQEEEEQEEEEQEDQEQEEQEQEVSTNVDLLEACCLLRNVLRHIRVLEESLAESLQFGKKCRYNLHPQDTFRQSSLDRPFKANLKGCIAKYGAVCSLIKFRRNLSLNQMAQFWTPPF